MKWFTFLLLPLVFAATVRADEQLRAVQQTLKDQGFYYGVVDGEEGVETNAAIRRYQIRNGLQVTGKLNAETLGALKIGSAAAGADAGGSQTLQARQPAPPVADQSEAPPVSRTAPPVQPPPNVAASDRAFLRQTRPSAPNPAAPAPDQDNDDTAAPVQPPPPVRDIARPDFATLFRRTPYEIAPLEVQRSTLRRAQTQLATEGFYRGIVDGEPGAETTRALAEFQREADLPPSGRLDMATLSEMRLLPNRRVVVPRPGAPFVEREVVLPPAPVQRRVYRGIWIR